jgi:hypothetical protein
MRVRNQRIRPANGACEVVPNKEEQRANSPPLDDNIAGSETDSLAEKFGKSTS